MAKNTATPDTFVPGSTNARAVRTPPPPDTDAPKTEAAHAPDQAGDPAPTAAGTPKAAAAGAKKKKKR